MTQAENTRLKAFSRRMRDEGAGGFAAGPWDESDSPASARQRQQTRWARQSTRQHRRERKEFSDHLLTWTAITALITLTVAIVGAWLSYQPDPGAEITRPIKLNKTTLERFETRLGRMEQRLSTILEPYIRMLNNLDTRLKKTSEELDARIRILEMGTIPAAENAYEARLQALESQLANTLARMDEVTLQLAALDNSQPASPTVTRGSDPAPPAHDRFVETTPATPPIPDMAWAETPGSDWGEQAPGNPFIPAPATVDRSAREAAPAIQSQDPVEAPAPAALTVTTGHTPQPAQETVQPVEATKTAPPASASPTPQAAVEPVPVRTGDWVINIASYTSETIARRKIAGMQRQGVDVELATAEVNGRKIYRARVFGFATRQAAAAQADIIQGKLGLKDTWIAKR